MQSFFRWLRLGALALVSLWLVLVLCVFVFVRLSLPDRYQSLDTWLTGWMVGTQDVTVLFQNNAEMRANGGFLSSGLNVRLFWWLPYHVGFFNSYDVDIKWEPLADAPPVFEQFFRGKEGYDGFHFRDTNWEVTLRESTVLMLQAFEKKYWYVPDALVFVDTSVLESLLRFVGPVRVADTVYTADTVFYKLEFETKNFDKHDRALHATRKNVLKDVLDIIVRKLVTEYAWRPWRFAPLIDAWLAQKHVLLYDTQSATAAATLRSLGVDNSFDGVYQSRWSVSQLSAMTGSSIAAFYDLLWVNLMNLWSRKSDRYLQKHISYDVYIDENGTITSSVHFLYKHQGRHTAFSTFYTWYQRVFVPFGSELLALYGAVNTPEFRFLWVPNIEKRKKVIQSSPADFFSQKTFSYMMLPFYVSLDPETESFWWFDIRQRYKPEEVSGMLQAYHLWLPLQPGNEQQFLHVRVRVPDGYVLKLENQNHPGLMREQVYTFDGLQTDDFVLDLGLERDTTPPIILDQKMSKDLSRIEVYFDRPIDPASLDEESVRLWDSDQYYPSVTDRSVYVRGARIEHDRQLTVDIGGVTSQPWEGYKLQFLSVRDIYGNLLQPSPHRVTVMQKDFTF